MPASTTRDAQRNALNQVRTQVGWVQNSTRTASGFGVSGADSVHQQFQILRVMYAEFTRTLTPHQLNTGGNELAELAAGLDIIQEAFANYQNDLAKGRSLTAALNELGQVMREATQVWLQQLNRTASRIRVGW
jgi:hypothetical protein